jgi:ABC-2 type transport system permease protein
MWIPFGLFLIAFRVGADTNFDYRPLLSFAVGLLVTGAAFVSMGVFFSTLTRNPVISGVLTFTGMVLWVSVFVLGGLLEPFAGLPANHWSILVLKHISFIDVWIDTLRGQLIPRMLMFPMTITIFWLFLSVKVLEARKWL